ncbi:MAG TPA: hypothetical protein VGO58_18690 [Chitinophagaceae bacterium]|jgi:hypothetical protein|nr:hypothetical protein [Chitinophagaceae bacterium]
MKPILVFIAVIITAGCSSPSKPFTEKRYTLASKETLKIGELNMTIINNGCGRKWIVEGEHPAFERAYCDIVINRGDTTMHAGNDSDPVYIGDIEIDIERMNPWGSWEDSIPPGGCRLRIKRTGSR